MKGGGANPRNFAKNGPYSCKKGVFSRRNTILGEATPPPLAPSNSASAPAPEIFVDSNYIACPEIPLNFCAMTSSEGVASRVKDLNLSTLHGDEVQYSMAIQQVTLARIKIGKNLKTPRTHILSAQKFRKGGEKTNRTVNF